MEMLLLRPDLRCDRCITLAITDKTTPLCKTARGCIIEPIATNTEITSKADKFIRIRSLLNNEFYRDLAQKRLKEEGLDDEDFLLQVEAKIKKWQDSKKG